MKKLSDELSFTVFVCGTPGNKAEDACEDNRIIDVDRERLVTGVLDGCGGSGSERYRKAGNRTGAKLASQFAGQAVVSWFRNAGGTGNREQDREDLKQEVLSQLTRVYERIRQERESTVVVKGLLSLLPTTLAMLTADINEEGFAEIRSYWAGNSRNYIFTKDGLQQVSYDDYTSGHDPFEDLAKDGILSNYITLSADFVIHEADYTGELPFLLLSATDGVFSYFDNPLRLEWILLDTLLEAKTPVEWERRLGSVLKDFSSDDYTIQIVAVGYRSFGELQKEMTARRDEMLRLYIAPLEEAADEDYDRQNQDAWDLYKRHYLAAGQELNNDE